MQSTPDPFGTAAGACHTDLQESAERYDIELDPTAGDGSHAKVLELVGDARDVLDLGCSSGYLARVLKQRGAHVVGLEIDPGLAQKARAHCETVIVGDLERLDLRLELEGRQFDAVICADVLEHLTSPWRTLEQLRALIRPGGFVIASIPNITHVSIALELLRGNFDYRPLGILDETHRRFFSKRGVVHLFERAGYWVGEIHRTYAAPHQMEIAQPLSDFGPELVRHVEAHDEAVTYQFIVKAVPFSQAAHVERMRTELEKLRAAQGLLEPTLARSRMESLMSQVEMAQVALSAAHAQADTARRTAAIREAELAAEIEALRREIKLVNALRSPRWMRAGLRRVGRALAMLVAFPRNWSDELTERTYRPRLSPFQDLRRSAKAEYEWESAGDDPQFRIEPPLPQGWVRVRLKGRASPAASATLYTGRGQQVTEPGHALGLLTPAGCTLELIMDIGRIWSARLDPSLAKGHFTIEEFTLQRVSIWRAALHVAATAVVRRQRRGLGGLLKPVVRTFRDPGPGGLKRMALRELRHRSASASKYDSWLRQHRLDEDGQRHLRGALQACSYQPVISILMEVDNPRASLISRCVKSVRDQLYGRWELCIVALSSSKDVRSLLEAYASSDPRIRVVPRRDENGTSAMDSVLTAATGDFIALIGQHDELETDALLQAVLMLKEFPNADLIYSDHDEIDEAGNRSNPYFKPEWSPETLLGHMYLSRLCVYRRSILDEADVLRNGMDSSREYDAALRVSERTRRIHHIARMLYHSRTVRKTGPVDRVTGANGIEVLTEALARRGIAGTVEPHPLSPERYAVRLAPDRAQRISIVIPTRDRADLLERCLESVFGLTTYPNFGVCVVDNGSKEQATFDLLQRFTHRWPDRFHVIPRDIPFNFPALVNAGVAETQGELVLLLNNDTEVVDGAWLDDMAGYAQRPEIGAVGCVLLYPNGTVQHGGVVLGAGGVAGHTHVGERSDVPGYFGRLLVQSNYAAVTAACLMVRREVFNEVGGFDEQLAIAFNDVDFCLKTLRRGYRNVCLGQVRLIHHESMSRGSDEAPENRARALAEFRMMRGRWKAILDRDPYYNPNLRSAPPTFEPLVR